MEYVLGKCSPSHKITYFKENNTNMSFRPRRRTGLYLQPPHCLGHGIVKLPGSMLGTINWSSGHLTYLLFKGRECGVLPLIKWEEPQHFQLLGHLVLRWNHGGFRLERKIYSGDKEMSLIGDIRSIKKKSSNSIKIPQHQRVKCKSESLKN